MKTVTQYLAKKVKELRLERRWTQARLARLLEMSQNRLSEIENGQGSFSAEQLIDLVTAFNVPLDYFVKTLTTEEDRLQNVIVRLGAHHLQENPAALATDRVKDVINAVSEVIAIAKSPRLVTGLALVIINHAEPTILNQIRYKLLDSGFVHRYGWVLANTLEALRSELKDKSVQLPKDLLAKYRKVERIIDEQLRSPRFVPGLKTESKSEFWAIDDDITTRQTFTDVQRKSSKISQQWGIVTRIQSQDFIDALRHGFNY